MGGDAPGGARGPLDGLLYASLAQSNDTRALEMRVAQKVFPTENLSVKLSSFLSDGNAPRVRLQAKHKTFMPGTNTRLNFRLRWDPSKRMLKAGGYGKRSVDLAPGLALNAKVEVIQKVDGFVGFGDPSPEPAAGPEDLLAGLHSPTRGAAPAAPAGPPPAGRRVTLEPQARIELSYKKVNVTTTQDVRLRAGVDLLSLSSSGAATWYAELRENHLALKVDSNLNWSVLFDV